MASSQSQPIGRITISEKAVATIAAHAALRSYGIVGMASRNLADGIAYVLAQDPRHGVEVSQRHNRLQIDLYVVIEYGTRVTSVSSSVARTVRYQVERSLGIPIGEVNVHVQDLHISFTE
ncbi:MAG: Asp23/Gls24 family envelope stress response protein [Anaerolineales bacterium]|nr:Asp23/Gls24 family envelope stress response protein [Anaerolineales bacterium]